MTSINAKQSQHPLSPLADVTSIATVANWRLEFRKFSSVTHLRLNQGPPGYLSIGTNIFVVNRKQPKIQPAWLQGCTQGRSTDDS
jgi:hypothetical protein